MRGQLDPQSSMFHYFSPESRVPAEHSLRKVKKLDNRALGAISPELDTLYAETGRPSIPPAHRSHRQPKDIRPRWADHLYRNALNFSL